MSNILKACHINSVRNYTDGGAARIGIAPGFGETSLNASTSIAASEGFLFWKEEVQPVVGTQTGLPQPRTNIASDEQAWSSGQSTSD